MKRHPTPQLSPHLQFVTTRTNRRVPVFRERRLCEVFVEAITELRRAHCFELYAYVIMPDHIHLLIRPPDGRVSALVSKIKSLSARRIIDSLQDSSCRRFLTLLRKSKPGRKGHAFKVWQDGFHAVPLWSEWMIRKKIDYIHANPLRKGLADSAEDYKWSSFCAYHGILTKTQIPLDPPPAIGGRVRSTSSKLE